MSLTPGTRLGPYEITGDLGQGGMGEVYRARDTALNRDVAIKVLPDSMVGDPDRLSRFQREAEALAALNHPNIAQVFGLEKSGDTPAIVMELVEGPTLADRIKTGAIPLDEALPIARQIAEALEAAHERGIIHRDLKPANVKVKDDGTVKVLDFGLAKAMDPVGRTGVGSADDAANSPTLTARATQMGMILGTAAYMAPEQAKGKHVDKRADVWAFGVVLFELLTGQRPFDGSDVSEVMAGVIKLDPDWSALPSTTPRSIHRLLRRCLVKARNDRLPDIVDARLEIDDAAIEPSEVTTESPASVRVWRRPILLVGAAVVLVALTALASSMLAADPPPPAVTRATLTIGGQPVENASGLAFSPDGQYLAFGVFGEGIYLRARDQLEPTFVAGSENGALPFFSSDGLWLGYLRGRIPDIEFRKVPVSGGPSVPIVFASGSMPIMGASWGPDGEIVFAGVGFPELRLVSDSGGDARPLTTPGDGGGEHHWPSFLPGGRAVVFSRDSGRSELGENQLAVVSLDTRIVRDLGVAGLAPRYLASGHLVFLKDGSLWAVPFDLDRLEIVGEARPVVEDVGFPSSFAVGDDGSLAHGRGGSFESRGFVVLLDPDGQETVLADEPGYAQPRFSPDGRRVAVERDDEAVWILDVEGHSARRLTTGRAPEWSPDGSHVIFEGPDGFYSQPWDGSADAQRLLETEAQDPSWMPDGATVLFTMGNPDSPETDWDLWTWSVGAEPTPWLVTGATDYGMTASPDGRWVAYVSQVSGQSEVYVSAFSEPGDRLRVSLDGGVGPVWSADGRSLYFVSGREGLWRVPFDGEAADPIGTPVAMSLTSTFNLSFDTRASLTPVGDYDVSPDGRVVALGRRILDPADAEPGRFEIVYHFAEELKRLVPVR